MFRNCEKCDFNCSCEVKDADHCPFDDPKVYLGKPVQPRVSYGPWHSCTYERGKAINGMSGKISLETLKKQE